MSATRLQNEPLLLADVELAAGGFQGAPPVKSLWKRARRWWRQETARVVEDDAIGEGSHKARPIRMVLPLVLPVLAVAALVVLREPNNLVGVICLAFGALAIGYGVVADTIEQRLDNGAVVPLINTAVYAAIISIELWCFLTIEHPRPYAHWIIFFLYFLLIGAAGLSDDVRQPLAAGVFSIFGYLVVTSLFLDAARDGRSSMAIATAPQFEWAGNAAKLALLAAATFTGAASARRGRAVRRLSMRDGLTGLLNRHAFDRCLAHLAQRAERSGLPMTVAMIDIDHFKHVNDTYGHQTGDAVLRWVGTWLKRSFRTTDVVSRYGGEEFVVAFLDSSNLEALAGRLDALRQSIEGTTLRAIVDDEEIQVTVSIGVAVVPRDGTDLEAVIAQADARLYEAKQAGRNQIATGPVGEIPALSLS